MQKLIITKENDKVSYTVEGDLSFTEAILLLFSVVQSAANKTIDGATKAALANIKKPQKPTKSLQKTIQQSVREDVADIINFAASNVLNTISPKDPSLQLTEEAIAGAENMIVLYAAEHGLTLKEALKEVDKILASYVKPTTNNSDNPNSKSKHL